jgi:malate dehydrogenase (oxaloacetate-decarboxylating)
VTAVPSVSHSITVRLEVPAGGASVSQLTTAVERAYGPTELPTDTEVAP